MNDQIKQEMARAQERAAWFKAKAMAEAGHAKRYATAGMVAMALRTIEEAKLAIEDARRALELGEAMLKSQLEGGLS